jgi:hypothetical protein
MLVQAEIPHTLDEILGLSDPGLLRDVLVFFGLVWPKKGHLQTRMNVKN